VGFDCDQDRQLAEKMAEIFDATTTFNELLSAWEILIRMQGRGEAIRDLDPGNFLANHAIRPAPMRPDQIGHGYAILEKFPRYLADSPCTVPHRGIALEDGAGHGLHIEGFAANFAQVFVVDLSLPYLLLAKRILEERAISNVTLVCASVERLPFTDACFDFIHSNNVIEHVLDQAALFGEAHRLLNDRGVLFLHSPNRFSLYFEPHFRLPGFGFIPKPIRRRIIRVRQGRDIDTIKLLSLGELRRLADGAFVNPPRISFVPRGLNGTATGGSLRGAFLKFLNSKHLGAFFSFLINRALLGVMPYHVAICCKTAGWQGTLSG
jgi:SAM-dependent methyltransferase